MTTKLLASLLITLGLAACGDDAPADHDAAALDASVVDSGPIDGAGPDADCFTNPTTHLEIINACTTADKFYKDPVLPLLLPDGGLPPIP